MRCQQSPPPRGDPDPQRALPPCVLELCMKRFGWTFNHLLGKLSCSEQKKKTVTGRSTGNTCVWMQVAHSSWVGVGAGVGAGRPPSAHELYVPSN